MEDYEPLKTRDRLVAMMPGLLTMLGDEIHKTAVEKGWWDCEKCDDDGLFHTEGETEAPGHITDVSIACPFCGGTTHKNRNDAESIALIHSELSEALEGLRHGNPLSDKIGDQGFSAVEEEFADVVIRILDVCADRGWRIGPAIAAKMKFNEARSYKHGGKKF